MNFLSSVASQLLSTFGTDLSRVAVVFPNKRASLFLNEELSRLTNRPLWSPAYITISQLFRSCSKREIADPIQLVCLLHQSFERCTGISESLDHFYSWGQILLADFDDVDKHQASAEKVFANLRNLHDYDTDDYLTEQQRQVLRQFFSHFSAEGNSELKQRFLSLWNHIFDIYSDFNSHLKQQGLAYEGALYREVAERTDLTFPYDYYLFVGFNLLQPVEQTLISRLEAHGKARLLQDTEEETPKQITILSAPTENIQARYIATWLTPERIAAGRRTAIVMADESLLQTVIHCLPPAVEKVNVTTGYPLSQTAIATEVLNRRSASLPQLLDLVQRRAKDANGASLLESEACFQLYTLLTRLNDLVDSGTLTVTDVTLQRLLVQLIGSTSIPFHGEPIEGIQVMGVLETRNLHFDHVLLLSCNEGNLPKGVGDTSFIPYTIRKAYGLTTIDHKVAIYENYFRRLIQRAGDVTLAYNHATTDGHTGEMSRFMLQLMVDGRWPISYLTLQAGQQAALHHPRAITKSAQVVQSLRNKTVLSPSALSRYLRCPLQFFYHDITALDEYLDPDDDTIDHRLFGNIFHRAAQLIYEPFAPPAGRGTITSEIIDTILHDESVLSRAVDQAIREELFRIDDPHASLPPLDGLQLINREVILRYLNMLLQLDRRLAPFTILALERRLDMSLSVSEAGDLTLSLGGFADRIDQVSLPDGTSRIRIIDYKTGGGRLTPLADVAAIFDPANVSHHSHYYLQAILYALMVPSQGPVSPGLLFIQHAGADDYDPTLKLGREPISDLSLITDEFLSRLRQLIAEIYDPARPFEPTDDRSRCKTCPFVNICGV